MNLEQWKNDANLRPALESLLAEPPMVAALEIVTAQGLVPIRPPVGTDIVQFGAMMGYRRDGYMEAIANLRELAKITARKVKEQKPWDIDPKTMPQEKFADDEKSVAKPEEKTEASTTI